MIIYMREIEIMVMTTCTGLDVWRLAVHEFEYLKNDCKNYKEINLVYDMRCSRILIRVD